MCVKCLWIICCHVCEVWLIFSHDACEGLVDSVYIMMCDVSIDLFALCCDVLLFFLQKK